jgi:hypothetical protein
MRGLLFAVLIGLVQVAPAFAQRGGAEPNRGIVTGQIQTRDGAPATAVRVSAIVAPPPSARPEEGIQYYEAPPPVSSVISDAQGRFRLANIPPGRYFIVAGILGQATYYPGKPEQAQATIVMVTAGTNMPIDFKLAFALGGRVSGHVTPPAGADAHELAVLSGIRLDEVLESPVKPDGTFEFGHLPKGTYLLNIAPTPPGMGAMAFELGDQDITSLQFVRPPVHTVSGRVVVPNGPLPTALLAFSTATTYEPAAINPDGTFSVKLQSARHRAELGGMPVGYSIGSVHIGSRDVTNGFDVANADVSGVVITVATPPRLPHVRGKVTGLPPDRAATTKVQMTGPIVSVLEVAVQPDGSFDFPAVTPGHYELRVVGTPQIAPLSVVVDWNDTTVQIGEKR